MDTHTCSPFPQPSLGAVGTESHSREGCTLLSKQTWKSPSREIHSTLCFNACSWAALWLRWARDAGEPEKPEIWGSTGVQAVPVLGQVSQSCAGGGGTSPSGRGHVLTLLDPPSTPGLGLTLSLLFVKKTKTMPQAVCHAFQFSTGMDFAREDFKPIWTSSREILVKKKDLEKI